MKIVYLSEVHRCHFTIKCIPGNTLRQKVEDYHILLEPENSTCSYGCDGLGNLQIYGENDIPHNFFHFHIEGNVVTGLSNCEELVDESQAMIFVHPHGLNFAGEGICAYFESVKPDASCTPYEKAVQLMHALYRDYAYQPNSTNVDTSAEEAFAQGYGVCQDYAHIFIALLHLAHIPARYVTGFLIGEGATHAWVEVLSDGIWYGMDPTNDCVVGDEHIRIGIGRDAKDCAINRGIMHGGGCHSQLVKACVAEIQE